MTFLRVKSTRDREYLYLVETRWDRTRGHPRQRVLQYLGPLERVRADDIPAPHLTPKVRASLARLQEDQRVRRAPAERAITDAFLSALLAGDVRNARAAARKAIRASGLDGFYGRTLPEAFRRIGDGWEAGRFSVPQEHLATAAAVRVIEHLTNALPPPAPGAPEVLLAVPEGETHALALALAEGLLLQRGFRPLNLAGTAPASAVVEFARERRPSAVLISVTGPRLLGSARTLAAQIMAASPGSHVAIGGQAVAVLPRGAPGSGVEIVTTTLPRFLSDWSSMAVPRVRPRQRISPGRRARRPFGRSA